MFWWLPLCYPQQCPNGVKLRDSELHAAESICQTATVNLSDAAPALDTAGTLIERARTVWGISGALARLAVATIVEVGRLFAIGAVVAIDAIRATS